MKRDSSELVETFTLNLPPAQGPGSGKAAWQAIAKRALAANDTLTGVIENQRAVIRELEAEVKLLRDHIAARKPKGGRERTADETVDWIERALAAGQSTRKIADQARVSAMTVSRVRKRMVARQTASA